MSRLAVLLLLLTGPLPAQVTVTQAETQLELDLARAGSEEDRSALLEVRRGASDLLTRGLACLHQARERADAGALDAMDQLVEAGVQALLDSGVQGAPDRAAVALMEAAREHLVLPAGQGAGRAHLERAATLPLEPELAGEVAFLRARFAPVEERGSRYEQVILEHPDTEAEARARYELAVLAAQVPIELLAHPEVEEVIEELDGPGTIPEPGPAYKVAREHFAAAIAEEGIWGRAARRAEKEFLLGLSAAHGIGLVQLQARDCTLTLPRPQEDPVTYRLYREDRDPPSAHRFLGGDDPYQARDDDAACMVAAGADQERLTLPGEGLYLLEVESARYLRIIRLAVSRARATVRSGEGRVVLLVTDGGGQPWSGARVHGELVLGTRSGSGEVDAKLPLPVLGLTDPSGLLVLEPRIPEGVTRVSYDLTVRPGTGYLHTRGTLEPRSAPPRSTQAYLCTARPLYRPGEQVELKGFVRTWIGSRCLEPRGVSYRLQVSRHRDGKEPVLDQEVLPGEWGSFHLDWQTSPELQPGLYHARLLQGEKVVHTQRLVRLEEFRTPEVALTVTADRPSYRPGEKVQLTLEASYHFGGAAAGLVGEVRVRPWICRFVTDAAGQATVTFTHPESTATQAVYAHVTDSGGRRVAAPMLRIRTRPTVVTAGTQPGPEGLLAVEVLRRAVRLDEGITLLCRGVDASGDPAAARGRLELCLEGQEEPLVRREVSVGRQPEPVHLEVPRGGRYVIRQAGRRSQLAEVHVAHPDATFLGEEGAPFRILTDRQRYEPGEQALVTLLGDANRQVLVEVETDRLERCTLVTLERGLAHLSVPIIPRSIPQVVITAAYAHGAAVKTRQIRLRVEDPSRTLTVQVTPDRKAYGPGQEATFELQVTDQAGQPVEGEVALGVVDEAIYDLQEELAPRLVRHFTPPARIVAPEPRLAVTVGDPARCLDDLFVYHLGRAIGLGGGAGGAFGGRFGGRRELRARGGGGRSSGAEEAPTTRRDLRHTAYWHPAVPIDAHGRATVTFRFPENLTAWRATARVMARGARAGAVRVEVVTRLPLMVRPRPPRFFQRRDELLLPALVRNDGKEPRTVEVTVEAKGITLLDAEPRTVEVAPADEAIVAWPVQVPEEGPAEAVVKVMARDARGGDAMEVTVPIQEHALRRRAMTYSGTVHRLELELPALTEAELPEGKLVLSPGPAGIIAGSLDYLARYPYGCTEQTMSRFLPAAVALAARARIGLSTEALDLQLEELLEAGLGRLQALRQDDGGWGWWRSGPPDLWMTSYVRFGLAQLQSCGVTLPPALAASPGGRQAALLEALGDPGTAAALLEPLPEDADLRGEREEARAKLQRLGARPGDGQLPVVLFFLAVAAAPEAYPTELLEPYLARWEELQPALQALLVQALAGLGETAAARERLEALLQASTHDPDTGMRTWVCGNDPRWWQDQVMAAALILLATEEVAPEEVRAGEVARWLLSLRQGRRWKSTRDTSFAVLALVRHLEGQERPSSGRVGYRVRLGDHLLASGTFAPTDLEPVEVPLPAKLLVTSRDLHLETTDGPLEADLWVDHQGRAEDLPPISRGLTLERTYTRVGHGPQGERFEESVERGAPVAPGDRIRVTLTLTSPLDLDYLILEDRRPSGFETTIQHSGPYTRPGGGRTAGQPPSEITLFDDRVAFFLPRVLAGTTTVVYDLVPSTRGQVHVLGARAEPMYWPALVATSGEFRFQVQAREAVAGLTSDLVLDDAYHERLARSIAGALEGVTAERAAALLEAFRDQLPAGQRAQQWRATVAPVALALPREVLLQAAVSRHTVALQLEAAPPGTPEETRLFLDAFPASREALLAGLRTLVARPWPAGWEFYWRVTGSLRTGERRTLLPELASQARGVHQARTLVTFLEREPERELQIEFLRELSRTSTGAWEVKRALESEEPSTDLRRALATLVELCRDTGDQEIRVELLTFLSRLYAWKPPAAADDLLEGLRELALERFLATGSDRELEKVEVLLRTHGLGSDLTPAIGVSLRLEDTERLRWLVQQLLRRPGEEALPALEELLASTPALPCRQVLLESLADHPALVTSDWLRDRLAGEPDAACLAALCTMARKGGRTTLTGELRELAGREEVLVPAAVAVATLAPVAEDAGMLRRALEAASQPGDLETLLQGLRQIKAELHGAEVLRVVAAYGGIDRAPPAVTWSEEALGAVDRLEAQDLVTALELTHSHHVGWYIARALGRRDLVTLPETPEDRYLQAARGLAGDGSLTRRLLDLLDLERSTEGLEVLLDAIATCADASVLPTLRERLQEKEFPRGPLATSLGRLVARLPAPELVQILTSEKDVRILDVVARRLPCRAPGVRYAATEVILGRFLDGTWRSFEARQYLAREETSVLRLLAGWYHPARPFPWRLRAVQLAGSKLESAREDPHPGLRQLATPTPLPLVEQVQREGLRRARAALHSADPARRVEAAAAIYALTAERVHLTYRDGSQVRYVP